MGIAEKFFKKVLRFIRRFIPIQIKRLIWKNIFYRKDIFLYKNDANIFTTIYKNDMWRSNESFSGGGSHMNTTKSIRKTLPMFWEHYNIRTFLDVPCGDFNWMKDIKKDNILYFGGDIVEELIEQNNQKYKMKNISFKVIDITQDVLPTVDMIFCKDCLQHLSYENVFKTLRNFKSSKSKYLLTTSYPLTLSNWDIFNGDYRPLNLRIKPFNLSKPIAKIHEKSKGYQMEKDKYMYLYILESLNV